MKKIVTILLALIYFSNAGLSQINYVDHLTTGSSGNDVGNQIDITNKGALLRCGSFQGNMSGYTSIGGNDALLVRFPQNGLANSTIRHGSGLDETAKFIKGYTDNIIEAGEFNETIDYNPSNLSIYNLASPNGKGVYISVYDTSSIPLFKWARRAIPNNINSFISINDMTTDKDGAIYIIGNFYGSVFFQSDISTGTSLTASTYGDVFFAKYNLNGNLEWIRNIGLNSNPGFKTGTSNVRNNTGNSIEVDSNKNIYIAGRIVHFSSDLDVMSTVVIAGGNTGFFIAKYDSNTNYINHFKPVGADTDIDEAIDLKVSNNAVYITGVYGGVGTQTNFDKNGTYNLPAGGFEGNGFVAKYDTALNFIWAKAFDNLSTTTNYLGREVYGNTLTSDANNNVYVGVSYKRNVELNPNGTSSLQNVVGGYDASLVKFSSNGNFLWAAPFAEFGNESINSIVVDNLNEIHIGGYFENSLNINPLGTAVNVSSNGGTDWLYAKYAQATVLPLSWLSFNIIDKNDQIHLSWETANEINCSHFLIQRSEDATSWKTIEKEESRGKNNSTSIYSSIDKNPFWGTMYYRIQQVDIDGHYSFSPIQKVTRIQENSIQLYPNPATMYLNIQLSNSEPTTIEIYSLDGKLIKSEQITTSQKIDISFLCNGNYLIKCYNLDNSITTRFIKR